MGIGAGQVITLVSLVGIEVRAVIQASAAMVYGGLDVTSIPRGKSTGVAVATAALMGELGGTSALMEESE